jgi:hypothetical protein
MRWAGIFLLLQPKEHQVKTIRNTLIAVAAGSALSLGAAAFAQDAKQPEPAKPQAKQHQHRGEHRHEGMQRMREMRQGGGCHGQGESSERGAHNHS